MLTWGAASALWLGILTSISPCPLATNIAAISFIGRRLGNPRQVLLSGSLYAFGRAVTYVAIGSVTVAGISSIPEVSQFLQKYMNQLLGPLLIVVGMVLLELIHFRLPEMVDRSRMQRQAETTGSWGAVGLGILFALSFCPVSAALFFGGLIPLSIEQNSRFVFPSLYGIGTALPVAACAVLIAMGTRSVGRIFSQLSRGELWVRRLTGGIFILVGIHYCLTFVFELL
jgi:cytochrome c-type biogenesis protein